MSELVSAAIEYLNAGLTVIALVGKAPNPLWHPHGLHDAIGGTVDSDRDVRELERIFDRPTSGIGIPIPANMCVADVDSDEAAAVFADMVPGRPDTAIARTRNGLHIWYFAPGFERSRWIGKLLLRGPGSYVAAPPSEHPQGGVYTWVSPLVVGGQTSVDWLPEGITRMLDRFEAVEQTAKTETPAFLDMVIREEGGRRVWYAVPNIDALVDAVTNAGAGNRNNLLAWAVMTARDQGVPRETAEGMLGEAAVAAGLSAREVRTTIRAAYRRGGRGA